MAEGLRRGDVLIVSAPGEYGKPRPSVVVQQNFREPIESVVICPLTGDLVAPGPIRPTIQPSPLNGLRAVSQVMADKVMAVRLNRCGQKIGAVSATDMQLIERALGIVLGLEIQPAAED